MNLTPKQEFLKVYNHESIPAVPGMEIEFQLYREYAGEWPVVGEEMAKLSPKERELAHGHNAEIMIRAAEACHHNALKDIGGYWEISPGKAADLYMPTLSDRLAHLRALRKEAGNDYFIFGTVYLPLSIPFFGDLTAYSMELIEEPEKCEQRSMDEVRHMLEIQEQLLEAGADGLIDDCDLAFNTGTFLSPEMMDQFFFPAFRVWTEACRKAGVPCIWHSDGNLNGIFDRILESGVGGLHCIDPLANMDIAQLKLRSRGKLTLIGNIDCSIIHMGTPQQCYEKATEILTAVRESEPSGHVFSSCNTIFLGMPKENYDAVIAARLDFNKKLRAEAKAER
ncbi:uroporphyrinogen decarboxylase family protein [Harryflintia acetispora]|uniref:uroporphyrinogen decarboxylase family protein n=1 Tax=Harryflintia acetispora TaxID=1849041 RepID=UPI001899F6DC|nr:uroporphyrinogen decarboxylase family protein [Harryflintia acetispora]